MYQQAKYSRIDQRDDFDIVQHGLDESSRNLASIKPRYSCIELRGK